MVSTESSSHHINSSSLSSQGTTLSRAHPQPPGTWRKWKDEEEEEEREVMLWGTEGGEIGRGTSVESTIKDKGYAPPQPKQAHQRWKFRWSSLDNLIWDTAKLGSHFLLLLFLSEHLCTFSKVKFYWAWPHPELVVNHSQRTLWQTRTRTHFRISWPFGHRPQGNAWQCIFKGFFVLVSFFLNRFDFLSFWEPWYDHFATGYQSGWISKHLVKVV